MLLLFAAVSVGKRRAFRARDVHRFFGGALHELAKRRHLKERAVREPRDRRRRIDGAVHDDLGPDFACDLIGEFGLEPRRKEERGEFGSLRVLVERGAEAEVADTGVAHVARLDERDAVRRDGCEHAAVIDRFRDALDVPEAVLHR
jgi:hypothetical protein